jgi:hypothetical protein
MSDDRSESFLPGGAEVPGVGTGSLGREAPESFDNYMTTGANFVVGGDAEVRDGLHKVGTFGKHTILTDEDEFLGGEGSAPMPLQYFLAGTAF